MSIIFLQIQSEEVCDEFLQAYVISKNMGTVKFGIQYQSALRLCLFILTIIVFFLILGYSSRNHFKNENTKRKKRRDHWRDFPDSTINLKFINNNNISAKISVENSEILSNVKLIMNNDEKEPNSTEPEHFVGMTGNVESFKPHSMNKTTTENEKSLQTDLAFSISKLFDKKMKLRNKTLPIYLTKCPCRRCQTIRRINEFAVNHQLNQPSNS